jgi:HAD domain in Swiss Army Knife RNA repair proteins
MEVVQNKYNSIIFCDFDGVLNHEQFYREKYKHIERFDSIPFYKTVKKYLRKLLKENQISKFDYYKGETCPMCMNLLNDLCVETNSAIVLSASMRSQWTVEQLQEIFNYCGATFTIIDKTPHTGYERGTEISKWLKENCLKWFGVHYYDFYRFIIIDDDNDFLLSQQFNFFQTDNYVGLTPTICYKIKRFLTHKTF